jgi:hypothetical protein
MFFGSEGENLTLANTAILPIQAQMPLICKGFVSILGEMHSTDGS